MRIPARATLGVASVASLLAATCSGSTESAIVVSGVTPALAYNNHRVNMVITGGPFRPAYDIDTGDGRAATQLGAFTAYLSPLSGGQRVAVDSLTWLSTSALAAVLRQDLPPGDYDVEVLDPRGAIAELPSAFTSLGRDEIPPIVMVLEPEGGTVVNPSAEVPIAFSARDAPGTLGVMRWTASSPGIVPITDTCPLGPASTEVTCRTVFAVPASVRSGQSVNLNFDVTDAAGNIGHAVTTLVVGLTPIVTGFAPHEGPAQGGTEISIEGANFITGTQVLIGGVPIDPGGGTVIDDKHIVGTTPAHDAGQFPVVVRTGGASVKTRDASFLFVGAPVVLAVSPTSGPPAGGTPVVVVGRAFREETRIRFGSDFETSVPLQCPTLVSPNRIQGFTPPGMGAVSIFVFDPVSGTSERPLAFTYLSEDSPDASFAAPPCLQGDGGVP